MFERLFRSTVLFLSIVAAPAAFGMTTLKQVQVKDPSQVNLVFDSKVGKSQIRTEFFNDVIQLSITDVSVYPAKISSSSGGDLLKVFAYQYAPKLVRCRLTVKGKAEDFKDKLDIQAGGRTLILRVGGQVAAAPAEPARAVTDQVTTRQALAARAPKQAEDGTVAPRPRDPEQAALLDHVMGAISAVAAPPRRALEPAKASLPEERTPLGREARAHEREQPLSLGGGKPLPSPVGVLGKLALVLGLFGAIALVMKKLSRGSTERAAANSQLSARLSARLDGADGWMGALKGMGRLGRLGQLGGREKLIDIISNHSLGPKKSIAVVKVMGRVLVLGVSNEAINLITQIDEGTNPEDLDLASLHELDGVLDAGGAPLGPTLGVGAPRPRPATRAATASRATAASGYGSGASAAGPSIFSNLLKEEQARPSPTPQGGGTVRSQIKSRLEGLKQL